MADEIGIPQPVDYGEMARQQAQGLDKAGGFDKLAGSLAAPLTDVFRKFSAYVVKSLAQLAAQAARTVFGAIGSLDPAFGGLAAAVVSQLFDVQVSDAQFTSITDSGSRKQIGVNVGKVLLSGITEGSPASGGGELGPDVTAAENFLGVMANLAIEGWTIDLAGEFLTLGVIKNLGELNESMAHVLGLGRLSRTVLRPFVNTLIALPATWSVNKQYRPKMLSVPEAIAAMNRGDIDEATMLEIAQRDGYGDDAIAALRNAAIKTLTLPDMRMLVRSATWQRDDAIAELRLSNHDAARAELLWNVEDARDLEHHQLELANAVAAAYVDRKIDEPTLAEQLGAIDLPALTTARIHELASQKRLVNVLHLTRADVESAVELEVLSTSDYADWLKARGYADNDALTLELMLQAKMNKLSDAKTARAAAAAERAAQKAAKLQAAAAKRDQVAAEHADWTGTLAQAERLVVRSVMPTTQYRQILIDHNLSAGDADAMVTTAVQDRDTRTAAIAKRAAAAAKTTTPALSLSALERATIMGALSVQQLGAELADRKYDQVDAGIIIDLVNDGIAARTAALARTAAAAARLASKSINLGQVQKAVVDGVQSLAQYSAFLTAQQFDATSIATLVADMQVQLDNRALANARHAAAVAKLEASHLSLAEEEKAVVQGILTLADYQGYLVAHDFDGADVAILTALLETKLPTPAGG